MKFLRPVVLVALALSACVKSETPSCGQALCPSPLVCVRPNECVRPEVLAACEGKLDSDACETPEGAMGICGDGVCIADTCGDGRVSFGEVCDGADLGGFTCETFGFYAPEGLVCAPDCGFDLRGCGGICGDGAANGSELCDGTDLDGATCQTLGYYYGAGLACGDSCFYDTTGCKGECGDDVTDPVEYCDGTVPQGESCLSFGYGAGPLKCSGLCGADLAGCRHLRWRTLETYAGTTFHHVWVGPNEEIVAVGEGLSMHRQGASWVERRFAASYDIDAQAVWGVAANDLWVAGNYPNGAGGGVLRYNGTQWVPSAIPNIGVGTTLYDIWGTSSSNVFAVGGNGVILKWNGSTWTLQNVGSGTFIRVVGTGPNDVYAIADASLYHYNGSSWSLVAATPAPATQYLDLWLDATNRLYAARYHESPARLDGLTWTSLGLPQVGCGASPSPSSIVATDTETYSVLHYDGRMSFKQSLGAERLTRHGSRIYGAGYGQVHVLDGGIYDALPDTDVKNVGGAWVSPTGNLYVAGFTGAIARFDGVSWTAALNVAGGNALSSIYGFGDNDMWVGGTFARLRHCSTTCTSASNWVDVTVPGSSADNVVAIWGRNSNDMYVASATGRLHRVTSNVATFEMQPTFKTAALHGTSDRVFAVGAGGKIATRQATTTWTESSTSTTGNLRAVCALANNDIWVFGDGGAVSHYNGTTWFSPPLPSGADFVDCAAYAADDILAVAQGELWHWNGQTFSPATPPIDTGVSAIAPTPGGMFFVSSYYDASSAEVTSAKHLFKPASW